MGVYRLVGSDVALLQRCPVGIPLRLIQHEGLCCLELQVADQDMPALDIWCSQHCIDAAPQGMDRSDVGLVIMDMDSTLITIECIDEIADFVGAKDQVAEITEAAMRGDIEFTQALHQRVKLLAGLPVETLEAVYSQRLKLSPGAEAMLAGFKAAGVRTVLVSGGFTFFTDRLKQRLGLDEAYANVLDVRDGCLTGRIQGSIVDGAAKAAHVQRLRSMLENQVVQAQGRVAKGIIAVGDGSNDQLMFAQADAGVAYHAKPALEAVATHCIRYGGLDTMLAFFPLLQTRSY